MNSIKILKQLTLEEKASLCSGKDFWHLEGIKRLDLPEIMVTDGPHGLRKQSGESDHVGLNESINSTCFPTASATASSWDVDLMKNMGNALGDECLQEQVSVLLGPGANIKRSPLCGRNFEYISEDPFLTGHMASALIEGIQSKGIGTSLKHFALNNQEYRRMVTDSVVDERTLREIYLPGFEIPVKQAQPWTVMCAYNKIDGIYCSENKRLLTDILKEEWQHEGLVVTDWGATNDRVEGVKAGLELEMPSSGGVNDQKIIQAVKNGKLNENDLDKVVLRILDLIIKSKNNIVTDYKFDANKHHQLAKKAAAESAVLLKNETILPLDQSKKITFMGEFFEAPRYQGSGSSLINPLQLKSPKDHIETLDFPYQYCRGYDKKSDQPHELLLKEAVEQAEKSDVVVIFAGLTDDYESEGFDRSHLNLPMSHNALIESVSEVNKNVVVVLQNGAPVLMPWLSRVKGVLESYLGGEAGGEAAIELLYGLTNPSGKLAETFPNKLEDCGSSPYFRMGPHSVEYREGLYVGYRYFDTFDIEPLYPFGFGLSYTNFEYSNLKINHTSITDQELLEVTFTIKNTGQIKGAEIAQVYVKDIESTIHRPDKELKGFKKVFLEPGESKELTLTLDKRAFAYYNVDLKDWHVETGEFLVQIGQSSRNIVLETKVRVTSSHETDIRSKDLEPEFYNKEIPLLVSDRTFKHMIQREIPHNIPTTKGDYSLNSTLGDVKNTKVGAKVYQKTYEGFKAMSAGQDDAMSSFAEAMMDEMPLRGLSLMSGGKFSFTTLEGLIDMMNGKYIRGFVKVLKK